MCVVAGDDGEHEGTDEETLNLDPTAAEDFNEKNRQKVPRHVTGCSDDEISVSVLEEGVEFGFAFGETDRTQQDGLVEVEAVKGHVDQEPGGSSADELLQMSPLAKVDHESLHLHVLGWWRDMRFDD